jgi:hypothetical protein
LGAKWENAIWDDDSRVRRPLGTTMKKKKFRLIKRDCRLWKGILDVIITQMNMNKAEEKI